MRLPADAPGAGAPAGGARSDTRDESAERRGRYVALAFALGLHILLAVGAYRATRPHPPGVPTAAPATDAVLHLRLIDTTPEAIVPARPPAPTSRMKSTGSSPPSAANAPLAPIATVATPPSGQHRVTEPMPRWVERDGGVLLPAPVEAPRTFSNRPLREPGAPDPFARHDLLPYTPTRFEKDWVPRDETLGGEWLRNATQERTVDLPQGYQLRCVWMLVLGGCGWGKAPQATIEAIKAMRADPPMPRRVDGPVDPAAAAPVVPAADPAAPPPTRPLDLSLPPSLEIPAKAPGGR